MLPCPDVDPEPEPGALADVPGDDPLDPGVEPEPAPELLDTSDAPLACVPEEPDEDEELEPQATKIDIVAHASIVDRPGFMTHSSAIGRLASSPKLCRPLLIDRRTA
jgi:hypothetical protein